MMGNLRRYLRGAKNLVLFALGARDYHWALSPLQQIVNYTASYASRQTGKPGWQRLAVYAYALLKYRENRYFSGMNFVARLPGPLGQAGLRNFVLWQDRMIRNQELPPGFRFNAAIVVGEGEEVQTDRLFSALCLSDTVNGFSIFWDRAEADRSFRAPMGLTEAESLEWRDGRGVFDLAADLSAPAGRGGMDAAALQALRAAEGAGVERAFRPSLDPRRQVTHYIKIAHPRSYRLAVSLPEDADGFADASLVHWLPRLQALAAAQEGLTICLLNRFVHGVDGAGQWPRGIHAVRQAGLTEQDVMAFAMEAEGYFGCLDIFGLAARSARVPGIYVGLEGSDGRGRPRQLVEPDRNAPELFAAVLDWWRRAEAEGCGLLMQPGAADRRQDGPAAPNAAGSALPDESRDAVGRSGSGQGRAPGAIAGQPGAQAMGGQAEHAAAGAMPSVGRGQS